MKLFLPIIIFTLLFASCQNSNNKEIDYSKMSISEMSKLIKKDSTEAQLYQLRAERYYRLNQIDSALLDYQKAVQIEGNHIDWLSKLSDIYLFKGQSEDARQTLDEALKLEPDNTDIILKMGMLYFLIEDHLKSFEYINQALSINPNLEQAYFYKSLNYKELGDTTRAIEELQKTVEKNPEYIEAYIQLGLLFDAKNDTMSRIYYKNALKIDSSNAYAHYDLALHYQHQKEFNKAIRQYLYLLNHVDSNFSTAYYNIGYIYLLYSDDFDTAISYFDKAIHIDYDYGDAYANKGYAYELQKKYKLAFVEYQTALKLEPNNSVAKKGLDRVSKFLKIK
jgi:tetratricopeptide (TPR) repeat protein